MRSLHDLKAPPSRVTERLANSSPAEGKEDELLQPPAGQAGRKQNLREATAELTNILSGVSSHCNALFFRFGLDQPMRQEWLTWQNAVARAAQLARELDALGDRKSGRGEDTVLNLNDLIADHARAIQSLM